MLGKRALASSMVQQWLRGGGSGFSAGAILRAGKTGALRLEEGKEQGEETAGRGEG